VTEMWRIRYELSKVLDLASARVQGLFPRVPALHRVGGLHSRCSHAGQFHAGCRLPWLMWWTSELNLRGADPTRTWPLELRERLNILNPVNH
jgi:hypothetical protein